METSPDTPANPYSAPVANLYGSSSGGAADAVSPSTIMQLAGTKPWVRFMSVLLWIIIGLVFLAIIIGGVMIAFGLNKFGSLSSLQSLLVIAFYAVLMFFYIYPAAKMWKFANRVKSLMATRSLADLDAALTEQRQLWKFTGILTIIGICIYLVAIIAAIAFGATAAMKAGGLPR